MIRWPEASTVLLIAVLVAGAPLALTGCHTDPDDALEEPVDEEALREQYSEEAAAEITPATAEDVLGALEEEIEADEEE